ncbi:hypothetical protein U1Q18_033082 [Sarracenia purpurea var. burkii]
MSDRCKGDQLPHLPQLLWGPAASGCRAESLYSGMLGGVLQLPLACYSVVHLRWVGFGVRCWAGLGLPCGMPYHVVLWRLLP